MNYLLEKNSLQLLEKQKTDFLQRMKTVQNDYELPISEIHSNSDHEPIKNVVHVSLLKLNMFLCIRFQNDYIYRLRH